jgi:antitoxin YefM
VPIALWKEIASERETAYLLKSETMRQRLHAALESWSGVSLDEAVTKLGLCEAWNSTLARSTT